MRFSALVVDATFGRFAAGVPATLSRAKDNDWVMLSSSETDNRGQVPGWERISLEAGVYCIVLDSDSYFSNMGTTTAYPQVVIRFRVGTEHAALQAQVTLCSYCYVMYLGQAG